MCIPRKITRGGGVGVREGLGMDKFIGFYISPYLMFPITFASVMHFHNHLSISLSSKILKEIFAQIWNENVHISITNFLLECFGQYKKSQKKDFPLYFQKVMLLWNRVSKMCGRAVVRPRTFFLTLRKILRFPCATKNLCTFKVFFLSFFTHIKWFLVIFFHFFLRKISKLKIWPRKKIYF